MLAAIGGRCLVVDSLVLCCLNSLLLLILEHHWRSTAVSEDDYWLLPAAGKTSTHCISDRNCCKTVKRGGVCLLRFFSIIFAAYHFTAYKIYVKGVDDRKNIDMSPSNSIETDNNLQPEQNEQTTSCNDLHLRRNFKNKKSFGKNNIFLLCIICFSPSRYACMQDNAGTDVA